MTYLLAEIHDGESTNPPLKTKLGAAFCTKLDAAASGTAGCFWGAVMFGLDCVGCPTSRRFCEKWDSGTAGNETRSAAGISAVAETTVEVTCARAAAVFSDALWAGELPAMAPVGMGCGRRNCPRHFFSST